MHFDDQNFFVIGTIEYANPSAFGKATGRSPEEVVFQLFGAWLFKAKNLAALRIDTRHDVPDGTVFAGSVHCLKNDQ